MSEGGNLKPMTGISSAPPPSSAEQDGQLSGSFVQELNTKARGVLEHAADGHRRGVGVYKSLRNLNEVIGTEYGDRVLYELVQNAHDAHQADDKGRIAVKLVVRSDTDGILYVANGGTGFRERDVNSIMNLATTAKEIGEGIGNKGLGFRSIEALTDDVRIFSQVGKGNQAHFGGYCFRFATLKEIEALLREDGYDSATACDVAATVPRYLVPLPITDTPPELASFARRGYVTVIVLPLHTADAIELAKRQTRVLADFDVPLLLFLDRIAEFRIDIETPNEAPLRRVLSRRQTTLGDVPCATGCRMHKVGIGEDRRFLVVQHDVDKARVLAAVKQSMSRAPQIKRWLDWKGQPTVSVAVGLSSGAVDAGRLYNFLPMGEAATAPLLGHLDAPFFAGVDRRDADFDLPLNATLMDAAAEACGQAALHIATSADTSIPQRSAFDLIAWTGAHAKRIDAAFNNMGTSLQDAPVIPAIPLEGHGWANLSEVCEWPGDFSLMKGTEVVKRTGARLAPRSLDGDRLVRLRDLARRHGLSLLPLGQQLAHWCERFAHSLANQGAAPGTWSRFYKDLPAVFDATRQEIKQLAGKQIILDRSKKLRQAGKGERCFVRDDATTGRRAKHSVPLPPSTLAKRYRFMDERIRLRPDTLNAFFKADLVQRYDPVRALEGLASALGAKASESRRREALIWAFNVWLRVDTDIGDALRGAELWVPTLNGWRLATESMFSSSWSLVGQIVEGFLVKASDVSADCRRAQEALLIDFAKWPVTSSNTKSQWFKFLTLLGVMDGLKPVEGTILKSGKGRQWELLVNAGDPKQGLDSDWCREASTAYFYHPYTMYSRKGAAWRLPGQMEHGELPNTAKEALQELAFLELEAHGAKHLTFDVGRFERSSDKRNKQTLPTPLATFLRCRAWIAAGTHEDPAFRKPGQCWAGRTKANRPPQFVDRLPDALANLVENSEELAALAFGNTVGLRDWHGKDTAAERLQVLASVAPALATHDRAAFRREYRRAWHNFSEMSTDFPVPLDLAVTRDGRLEKLAGDAANPATVILTEKVDTVEARILSSAGYALLDIGDDAAADYVAERLDATGLFSPRQLNGQDVRLVVDGETFTPSVGDPLLTTFELGWLPELVVLGHTMLAEGLERVNIQPSTIERRVRDIRVRRCETITLAVDEADPSSGKSLEWYAFGYSEPRTLILSKRMPLSWTTLSQDLSRAVSKLIDGRLRFLEPLLLRLAALSQDQDTLYTPTEDTLAKALGCDSQILRERRAELRTDIEHVLHLIAPVIAYFGDVELARQLVREVDQAQAEFDIPRWLRARFPVSEPTPEGLLEACGQASNRVELRRKLRLDYERFNRVLLDLGEPALSNEAELRSMYEGYLGQMRTDVLDRLRRRHVADFRDGRALRNYVECKTLAFLEFNDSWILTRETLDRASVEDHVEKLLNEVLGEDCEVNLPPWPKVLDKNRRSLRDFATQATPVVHAWCGLNGVRIPDPWQGDDPQSIVRHIEDAGLLDFELVDETGIPDLCIHAVCWPDGMHRTLDLAMLGLDPATVEEDKLQRERKRERRTVEKRSIDFAGAKLDTGAPSFAQEFRLLAENSIATDQSWLQRSRPPKLAEFPESERGGSGGRGATAGSRRRQSRDEPKDLKQAMGLASEWLAFQYLRNRHPEAVDETCWISGNRHHFFGGGEGDDAAGYDLCVKTPQAEWLYEVKSSLEDTCEFELTPNEMRVAASTTKYGRRRYRILYVPYVFSPERWFVLELPNPMGDDRNLFKEVGRGAVRFRFEGATAKQWGHDESPAATSKSIAR